MPEATADTRLAIGKHDTPAAPRRRRLSDLLERVGLLPTTPGDDVYHAFISYSHAADGKLAPALQTGLQRFAKPWYRARAVRVFRDDTALSASPHLWASIQTALDSSHFFILLASPDAAASDWVAKEVQRWRATKPVDRLLVGLTDGELVWDEHSRDFDWTRTDSLPQCLQGAYDDEPRYIDMRWAKGSNQLSLNHPAFRDAVAELAAPLHGKPKDELAGEEVRQHRRTLRIARGVAAALVVLTLLAVVAAGLAVVRGRQAALNEKTATSRELAAQSLLQRENDPELSLLLAVEAAKVRHTPEAQAALRESIAAHHLRRTFRSSGVRFHKAVWSPEGARAAIASDAGARLWDPIRGRALGDRGSGSVLDTSFDPGGERLLTVGWSQPARIWRAGSRAEPVALRGTGIGGPLSMGAWSRDGGLVIVAGVGGEGGEVSPQIFDSENGRRLQTLGPARSTYDAQFSPDGRLVLTAGDDGKIRLWSVSTGEMVREIKASGPDIDASGLGKSVYSARFSPRGRRILTGGADGSARVFDVRSGRQLLALRGHSGAVVDAIWSPNGKEVATSSTDHTARLWTDLRSGGQFLVLRGHSDTVLSADFSPDGALLATAGADGVARVWDAATGNQVAELRGHEGRIMSVDFSRDGRYVLTAGSDNTARLWNSGRPVTPTPGPELHEAVAPEDLPPNPLAPLLAVTPGDGAPVVINSQSGAIVGRVRRDRDLNYEGTAVDGVGDVMLVMASRASRAERAQLRTLPDGRLVHALSGSGGRAVQAAIDDSGQLVAAMDEQEHIGVWDIDSGRRLAGFNGHRSEDSCATTFKFSPDGTLVLSEDDCGHAFVWEARTGRILNRIRGPRRDFDVIAGQPGAISPNNELAVTVSRWDQEAHIFRVGQQRPVGALRGHGGWIDDAAFSPDGTLIATTGGGDNTTRVWDTQSQRQLLKLEGGFDSVRFSSSGESIVTNGIRPDSVSFRAHRAFQTFTCDVCGGFDRLLTLARQRLSRRLTADERRLFLH